MGFLSALSLLWALPVGGLIVAAYILKLRRRDVVVPSTLLWSHVIRDVQANAPFQRLRRSLLLLLQLLAAALLVMAVARPFWRQAVLGGRSMVLVIDVSASMAATDVRPDRMGAARSVAAGIIGGMRPGDQMLVIAAGARPVSVTPFTGDGAVLRQAVDALAPAATGAGMRDALALASALVASRTASRIDVISDGGFGPVTGVDFGRAQVAYHPVGAGGDNLGIVAAGCRRTGGRDPQVEVLVTVRSTARVDRTVTMSIARGSDTVDAREIRVPAGGEASEVFDFPEQRAELDLTVRLDVRDALALDNEAYLAIPPRRPVRTLLVSAGNPYLEKALQADADVDLYRAAPAAFPGPAGYDAVVLDGEAPASLVPGPYLYAGCAPPSAPVVGAVPAANEAIIDTDRQHPVLRFVDFGRTRWTSMLVGRAAPTAREIASSGAGAAVVASEQGSTRSLWTGFRLDAAHGSFPGAVAYPVFVSAAVRWLAHAEDPGAPPLAAGSTLDLEAPAGVPAVSVRTPDGVSRSVPVPPNRRVRLDDLRQPGFTTVTGASGFRRVVAVNLANPVETDIAPRPQPGLGGGTGAADGRRIVVTREMWPAIAAALLALLAAEWWAFHRRVFVA